MRRLCLAGVSALAVGAAYLLLVRPWHLAYGATGEESRAPLPGDDLIPSFDLTANRAITIRAPAKEVWCWIAQLGQGRGGFYSYDFLENLAGCQIHSAEVIVPEWQAPAMGDEIKLHPEVPLQVAVVEPGRALVLRGGVPMGNTPPPYDFTWSFVLQEQPDETTRLLVRERYAYTRSWARLLVEPVEAISFIMSQKMLRGIKDRAERSRLLPMK
ncbi:MAG: SRPBCC family protein [Thermoleophilia bacterium]|nr:SRPBCC family protein [Thermoleophilia bacterium]